MFGSVTLDIVISLVFIYLLYSLFATVLSEIIATKLGLRARNLKEAINRMLSDEKNETFLHRLWDSLRLMKNPKTRIIQEFYNHPEIKYLGSSGVFQTPSSFKSVSFSKTLLNLLSNDRPLTKEILDDKLKHTDPTKTKIRIRETLHLPDNKTQEDASKTTSDNPNEQSDVNTQSDRSFYIDSDTSKYLRIMWAESNGDIAKFKFLLEGWFDRTMEQATEWYKRKIQIILLVLGFLIAWFFNADTFTIIGKLSVDKDARDKMVSMANAYIQSHPNGVAETVSSTTISLTPTLSATTTSSISPNAANDSIAKDRRNHELKMDSLIDVKNKLEADINNANNLLGLGAWLPDSLEGVVLNQNCSACMLYSKQYNYTVTKDLSQVRVDKNGNAGKAAISFWSKIRYLFSLLSGHFWGFLITAIAVSLGAPFWFDLLNKLMKLRTSAKQDTDSTEKPNDSVSLDQRVG